jgi:hypothetical protein
MPHVNNNMPGQMRQYLTLSETACSDGEACASYNDYVGGCSKKAINY